MPLKIVRNDITQMTTEAVVNTANPKVLVGSGCDMAIYKAAGYDQLLTYRAENIGQIPEGEVFLTPGFDLKADYIIHAVSPAFVDGQHGEEDKLRSCYRKSLALAKEQQIRSISFPLISTGSFGYPKEEGLRIAVDEINTFLQENEMQVYLVVFDTRSTILGNHFCQDLEEYIDLNYVKEKQQEEYGNKYEQSVEARRRYTWKEESFRYADRKDTAYDRGASFEDTDVSWSSAPSGAAEVPRYSLPTVGAAEPQRLSQNNIHESKSFKLFGASSIWKKDKNKKAGKESEPKKQTAMPQADACVSAYSFEDTHESDLEERIRHLSDTFSQYLIYLIQTKNMTNAEVYKRAIIDKKVFSKIKNNVDYHPQKVTALCLCMGAKLNLDETIDLLARAGYALSPCDKTDIIFSFFIEHEIYDMLELDIQLEEHGLPCLIS